MSPLSQLLGLLPSEDPDFDDAKFDEITELTEALVAEADRGLVPELERHLHDLLEREDFYGRDVVGEVLAGIAGADALPVLLRASARDLGDDQDTFQMIICDLLEEAPERTRPAVLDLVDADDAALRSTGVRALDFIVENGDLPRLRAALDDPHPGVRTAAAGPLGNLAKRLPAAVDALVTALEDPEPHVRVSVLAALGSADVPAVVPHVNRLVDDPDGDVRRWAGIALERLGEADTPHP